MNKKSLSIIFIFIILFLSGCSNSNNDKPLRKLDSSNDKIKFLNIDWLTERKEVEKIIENTYGNDCKKNSYKNHFDLELVVNYSSKKAISEIVYSDSNDAPLLWELGNQKMKFLNTHYYSNNKGNPNYLYYVEIYFDNPSIQGFDDLVSLYDKLYDRTHYNRDTNFCVADYSDSNNNILEIMYSKTDYSENLIVWYVCREISDMEDKEYNEAVENESKRVIKNTN